jgi:hypothetical protein
MKPRPGIVVGLAGWLLAVSASAQVERIWLTHKTSDPNKIVVNWETAEPGNSVVRFGLSQNYTESVAACCRKWAQLVGPRDGLRRAVAAIEDRVTRA